MLEKDSQSLLGSHFFTSLSYLAPLGFSLKVSLVAFSALEYTFTTILFLYDFGIQSLSTFSCSLFSVRSHWLLGGFVVLARQDAFLQ
ncbi:hypothetical protein BS50DRAFT_104208 [Corynespora cassiicola Philippines]|uniref:Uncharacterized protein n=1 Tax=Corynespora cassiicola Philippines TaxID=1448308 RepID=A0A2T2NCC5_CORCC|nr:hypothetical protein BS50DRAFT_104208 [Corynespora cassiicola Philippines]